MSHDSSFLFTTLHTLTASSETAHTLLKPPSYSCAEIIHVMNKRYTRHDKLNVINKQNTHWDTPHGNLWRRHLRIHQITKTYIRRNNKSNHTRNVEIHYTSKHPIENAFDWKSGDTKEYPGLRQEASLGNEAFYEPSVSSSWIIHTFLESLLFLL
jgi:hypothetical protein